MSEEKFNDEALVTWPLMSHTEVLRVADGSTTDSNDDETAVSNEDQHETTPAMTAADDALQYR